MGELMQVVVKYLKKNKDGKVCRAIEVTDRFKCRDEKRDWVAYYARTPAQGGRQTHMCTWWKIYFCEDQCIGEMRTRYNGGSKRNGIKFRKNVGKTTVYNFRD